MSYTPTTWQNGDVITAEKLNHLEGGASSLIVIKAKSDTVSSDVTIPSKGTQSLSYLPESALSIAGIKAIWFENESSVPLIPIVTQYNGMSGQFAQMSLKIFNADNNDYTISANESSPITMCILYDGYNG